MSHPKLSEKALAIVNHNPDAFRLLVGPGSAPAETTALLKGVSPESLFSTPIENLPAAHAALAALWLYHDGLHECHRIVQREDFPELGDSAREMTATYAFWHAIMHRREGDFSNSKYWYARCRNHPAHALMKSVYGKWDPNRFVDQAESAHDDPKHPDLQQLIDLQKLEWTTLFDWTTERALRV